MKIWIIGRIYPILRGKFIRMADITPICYKMCAMHIVRHLIGAYVSFLYLNVT